MIDGHIDSGTLTAQEIDASRRALFDLGPGYPQLRLPEWCQEIVSSSSITSAMLSMPMAWRPSDSVAVDARLGETVRTLLGITPSARLLRPTFSGSVALERGLTAAVKLARERGCKRVRVLTTSPSIDIVKLFLCEHVDITSEFVATASLSDLSLSLDRAGYMNRLSDAIERHPEDLHVALLTSPENPTGEIWSSNELSEIASICVRGRGVLMLDHCFLLAGVHDRPPASVWEVAKEGLEWIGIWDTGKTLGLNEEKLGFIAAGGETLPCKVDEALSTIQFDVSRRQKMMFTQVLSHKRFGEYVTQLRAACVRNCQQLREVLASDLRARVRIPTAGTFALVDCEGLGHDDQSLRQHLLGGDVGVIAGRIFFHVEPVPSCLIRIALAREPDYFATSISRLHTILLGT